MNAVEKLKAELESAIAAVIKQYAETVQRSYEVEAKQIWDRLVGENIRHYSRLRDGHHRELDRQARWVSHLFFEKVPGKYGEMPQELLMKEFPAKAVSAIAAKEAAEQAADAQVSYIKKNMQKLSPLVTTRILKSVHLKSTGIKDYAPFTMLDFVFEDGSHFTVMNQLVWVSNVANPFTRFPTTFHNAEIDGVKVASPSEAKLKLLMNKTTATLACKALRRGVDPVKLANMKIGAFVEIKASSSRHCAIYKTSDGKWYMELAADEYGEESDADCYGPFSSENAAEKYLDDNFSNPGGIHTDSSGKEPPPTKAPNGTRVIKPR